MPADWLDHDWVRWFLLPGLVALLLAGTAWLGDRRRMRRSNPDAVGFMPWTNLFVISLFAACVLLMLAANGWRGG